MRVSGTYGKWLLHTLTDSSSTHNFVNEQLAHKVGCFLSKVTGIRVIVIHGHDLEYVAIYERL